MSKAIKIRVLATNAGGIYAGPFRDTTVGKVYSAILLDANEPSPYHPFTANEPAVSFTDDVGDHPDAFVAYHEGCSYEVVE